MKIRAHLSIGYPTAEHSEILVIPDKDLEGLNETDREKLFYECVEEWANEYVEYWYEEIA